MTSGLREFATSKLRRFEIPDLRKFATSELRRFKILDLRKFATSGLCRFKIPDLRKFDVPENSFHEFHKPRRFEGDMFSSIPQHLDPIEAKFRQHLPAVLQILVRV
jgi:hypothetical protein